MASPIHAISETTRLRVAVIGAGVIGLSCALQLLRRGADVQVYESGVAAGETPGATIRAAGMLGAGFEAAEGAEDPVFRLALHALRLWDGFAAEVTAGAVGTIGYSKTGSLACAVSPADEDRLQGLAAACTLRGVDAELLSGAEARRLEPALAAAVRSVVRLPGDGQVDARLLASALLGAVQTLGGEVCFGQAVDRISVGGRLATPDGQSWDRVLIATGAGARPAFVREAVVLADGMSAILPVKGQMLALAPYAGAPVYVIRMGEVYVAPKASWILVGATSEPGKADTGVEAEAIARLRAAAGSAVNGIGAAQQVAAWAGVRPATSDGAPMIGETAIPGVFAAMGHYRNGILLAPATAELMADMMLDGKVSADAAAFDPLRFDNRAAVPHSRSSLG